MLVFNLILFFITIESVISSNWLIKQPRLIRTGFTNILWEYIDSDEFKSNDQLTKQCKLSLNHVNQSLSEGQIWPIKLIETSGRIPEQFSGAGYASLGDFDKCQQLTWTNYNGDNQIASYCLISLLPDNQNYDDNIFTHHKLISPENGNSIKIGLCLPADCSTNDLQIITINALKPYDWELIKVDHCSIYQTPIEKLTKSSRLQKVCFLLTVSLVAMALIANLLEYKSTAINKSKQLSWLKCFSFKSSYQQIFQPNLSQIKMLNLLQYSIMLHSFVLIVHINDFPYFGLNFPLVAIIWGSFPALKRSFAIKFVTIDWYYEGIFAYGGAARTITTWRQVKPETRLTQLLKSTVIKLISLSVLITITLIIHITLLMFSSGPLQIADRKSIFCTQSFWQIANVFDNNYCSSQHEQCLVQFWSVSVEAQCLLVIVILVFLYKRKPKIAMTINLIGIIGSILYISLKLYIYRYPAHLCGIDISEMNEIIYYVINVYATLPHHFWIILSTVLYIYLMVNDYGPVFLKFPLLKLLDSHMYLFGLFITISQLFYPNLIKPFETPLVISIYETVHRLVICLFFLLCGFRIADETKSQVSNNDVDTIDNNNQEKSKIDSNYNDDRIAKYKFYSAIATILRSTFCIHMTILIVTLNTLRKPISTNVEMLNLFVYQLISCLLGGLLFHFFVLGPFTNLVLSMKSKPKSKSK